MLCPEERKTAPGRGRTLSVPPLSPPGPPPRGGAYKFLGFGSRLGEGKGEGKPRCSNTPQDPRGVGGVFLVVWGRGHFFFPQHLVEGLLNFRRRVCRSFWLDLAFQDPPGETDQYY